MTSQDSTTRSMEALTTYFTLMEMHGSLQLYRVAQQQGIFTCLQHGPLSAQALAERLAMHPPSVEKVLVALCDLALVERHALVEQNKQAYRLAPVAALLAGNYQQLGAEFWDHLPTLLKTGQPLIKMDDPGQSAPFYVEQVKSLYWMMLPAAHCLGQQLKNSGAKRILDIGAGSGVWGLTVAQYLDDVTLTLNDWPSVLEVAKDFAAQQPSSSQSIHYIPGNYHQQAFGHAEYDLIILGNIIHLETPENLQPLLRKLRTALAPQGQLAIVDVVQDGLGQALAKSLYNLGLALRTENGTTYSIEQLIKLLNDSGFTDIQNTPLNVPPHAMSAVSARCNG